MSLELLTDTQRGYFFAAMRWLHERGVWPTTRELGGVFGCTSSNAATEVLRRLARRGLIERSDRARVCRVTEAGWELWAAQLSFELGAEITASAARVLTLSGADCPPEGFRLAADVVQRVASAR